MEMANPHGDTGRGSKTQAIAQTQHNIFPTTEDWDAEILNHMLVHVLDKDMMDANVTNKFVPFLMHQRFDNIWFIVTMSQEDFKSMGCNTLNDVLEFSSLEQEVQ